MTTARPHIFFHSSMDSGREWRDALATQFELFTFSAGEDVSEPETVDVAIVWTLPESGLGRFKHLRAILSLGAGINQLDPKLLPPGVPIARLVDSSLTRMMVDYAKTATYRHHRKFHLFEARTRERAWIYIAPTLARSTTVGVLGLGVLGGEISIALQREGFVTLGWSRTLKSLPGVETFVGRRGLEDMVARCDIVINVLPLTAETMHVLSADLFAHFKASCCLVNMGRGAHLQEEDLLTAIDSGRIEAATLDVTAVEPLPRSHALWNHPRILLTPHVAGTSIPQTAVIGVADNIRRALAGSALQQQVDLQRGY